MRVAVAMLYSLVLSATSQAAFTDFSDYTEHARFDSGEIFTSKGISFKAVDLLPISNEVWLYATPAGAALLPSKGVEFLLPPNIQKISLTYYGADVAIAINGVQPTSYPGQPGHPQLPGQSAFDFLDGTSLGGVSISATHLIPPPLGAGYLVLQGPIGSLVIAGLELSIDDITVQVPEPTAGALIFIALGFAQSRRLRLRDVK